MPFHVYSRRLGWMRKRIATSLLPSDSWAQVGETEDPRLCYTAEMNARAVAYNAEKEQIASDLRLNLNLGIKRFNKKQRPAANTGIRLSSDATPLELRLVSRRVTWQYPIAIR